MERFVEDWRTKRHARDRVEKLKKRHGKKLNLIAFQRHWSGYGYTLFYELDI